MGTPDIVTNVPPCYAPPVIIGVGMTSTLPARPEDDGITDKMDNPLMRQRRGTLHSTRVLTGVVGIREGIRNTQDNSPSSLVGL